MFRKILEMYNDITNKAKDISLLLVRLVLAYGFYEPAMMKWKNISNVSEWFGSMGIPLPLLNAYLAASTEALGVILLALGLGTKYISFPLIIVMIVAIFTAHISNGFAASDNGFEIPLYYMIMLIVLLSQGAGNYSVDKIISKK